MKASHAAVAVAVGAVAVLAYMATRAGATVGGGPAQKALTELEAPAQDFQEHLAHISELFEPVFTAHRFPARTCPGTNAVIHNGFGPQVRYSDPQLAMLPAEQAW